MIPRYSRPEMVKIWSDQNRYQIWLEVETVALEGMVKYGLAPEQALKTVREKGAFNIERVAEIELEVKHDVIAFLTNVAEIAGEDARYLHRGMTSSDLLDTSFAIQLKQAGEILLVGLDRIMASLLVRANEFKDLPTIGRSHGIHAEPTSFGLKFLSCYAELKRNREGFVRALRNVSVGKIAGAVGTYASIPPKVEQFVFEKLGLTAETVPSQIVHRDRHAEFFHSLAMIASAMERFCVEVRHLQRTEVREVAEKFTVGQKGSSAMPHKMNPILTENLTGLARLIRGYASTAMENIALWHERDISHSSVERIIAPDACVTLDFMMERFRGLIDNLVVFPEQVKANLELTRGCVFSGTLLLALVDAGFTREQSYKMVQDHALAAWKGGKTLEERVNADSLINSKLSPEKIAEIFNLKRHLAHVDEIFARTIN